MTNRLDKELREATAEAVNAGLDLFPDCPVCGAGLYRTDGQWIEWRCGTTLRLQPHYRAVRSSKCKWPNGEEE